MIGDAVGMALVVGEETRKSQAEYVSGISNRVDNVFISLQE